MSLNGSVDLGFGRIGGPDPFDWLVAISRLIWINLMTPPFRIHLGIKLA